MKIWCDVCDSKEASVFCCADEAALCHGCDRHVHFANKLAEKHPRFSLSLPSFKDSPLCDICRERRGMVFCREDRAILCRECDLPMHQTNEHTQKHSRFLLTNLKLSVSSSPYPKIQTDDPVKVRPGSNSGEIPSSHYQMNQTVSGEMFSSPSTQQSTSSCYYGMEENGSSQMGESGGSISEYLMETLPGWRVEDLLDHPSCLSSDSTCNAFSRVCGDS